MKLNEISKAGQAPSRKRIDMEHAPTAEDSLNYVVAKKLLDDGKKVQLAMTSSAGGATNGRIRGKDVYIGDLNFIRYKPKLGYIEMGMSVHRKDGDPSWPIELSHNIETFDDQFTIADHEGVPTIMKTWQSK